MKYATKADVLRIARDNDATEAYLAPRVTCPEPLTVGTRVRLENGDEGIVSEVKEGDWYWCWFPAFSHLFHRDELKVV